MLHKRQTREATPQSSASAELVFGDQEVLSDAQRIHAGRKLLPFLGGLFFIIPIILDDPNKPLRFTL